MSHPKEAGSLWRELQWAAVNALANGYNRFERWNTDPMALLLLALLHACGSQLAKLTGHSAFVVSRESWPWYVLASESLQGTLFRLRKPQLHPLLNPHLFMTAAALFMPYQRHILMLGAFVASHAVAVVLFARYVVWPAYLTADAAAKARRERRRAAKP